MAKGRRSQAGECGATGAAGASGAGAAAGPGCAPGAGATSYLTMRAGAEATAEFVDRKSRFIAQLTNVETEDEAAAFIDAVRARHYDARHDGEPQRTSGMPTLEVLRGAGLANVCCVVTRYFGGTLLGPGGLVRAYSTATQRVVDTAYEQGLIVEMTLVCRVVATISYSLHDRVRVLAERSGAHVVGTDYAADVRLTLAFRAGEEAAFVSAMRELANGEDLCEVFAPEFAEF